MSKMKKQKILVFFLALASVLLVLPNINAAEIADIFSVEVDGVFALDNTASIIAGETISIEVFFDALRDASDVKIEAELKGNKIDVEDRSVPFDTEGGLSYRKTLTIKVPYELEDEVSDDLVLNIKIWNRNFESERSILLRVQRTSYDIGVMSISSSQTADAGETLPVDVVIKNVGYNKLNDVYVTAKIPELNIKMTSYFGDIVTRECFDEEFIPCREDDEDTARGRFFLKIPYDAKPGVYNLEVEARNKDVIVTQSKQIIVSNDFSAGNIIATTEKKNVAVGQEVDYELLIVNPTDKLKVYKVIPESSASVSVVSSQIVTVVPAGSSKTVTLTVKANSQGEHNFKVNVFSGEQLVNTFTLGANASGTSLATPVVVLTIVLAVVFVVLIIVLIVLLGKKPKKESEELGESYY